MKTTTLILALALAATTGGAFAQTGDSTGSSTADAVEKFFAQPIVQNDEVQELYREEPWVNPLPEFWGFEHPQGAAAPAVTPRETGVQIEQENERDKASLEREGFPQYND